MGRQSLALAAALLVSLGTAIPGGEAGQIELDRIVSRAGGRIITQSDIRQARALRLVDDVSSDESTQRGLEARLLILAELDRAAPTTTVAPEALTERRAEWTASIGPERPVSELLGPSGMTEADLEAWLRDDLRIRAYLGRQFGMLPEGERDRAIEEWIDRLRQRAELQ